MSRTYVRALVVPLLLLGCQAKLDVPAGAHLSCQQSSDCPADYVCTQAGICLLQKGIDTSPLDLMGPVRIAPTDHPGRQGTAFTIDFDTTKPLLKPPAVTLQLATPTPLTCTSPMEKSFHCTYIATGDEGEKKGGTFYFDVELVDTSGNVFRRQSVGALQLDFTPPSIIPDSASLQLIPDKDNPLPSVLAVKVGTEMRVFFAVSEPLQQDPALSLKENPSVTFTRQTAAGTSYLYTATITDAHGIQDGPQTLLADMTDLAGNEAKVEIALAAPGLVLRTAQPTLTVDQTQVVFLRAPQGDASGTLVGTTLVTGPYFALAPKSGGIAGATLPASTFSFGQSAPSALRVRSDEVLLGLVHANTDGSWPVQPLALVDKPTVTVSALDDAGNESARVKIETGEWVATTNGATQLATSSFAEHSRQAHWSAAAADATLASGSHSAPLVSRADGVWLNASNTSTPSYLSGLYMFQLAYDAMHGRTLLLDNNTNHVFEWDGHQWLQRLPMGGAPSAATHVGWAFDSTRGRVFLWNGDAGVASEWDGQAWKTIPSSGAPPSGRELHIAYDSQRDRVVLVTELSRAAPFSVGVWEWDGATWTERPVSGAAPESRQEFSITYDADHGRVLLFGGQAYTGASPSDLWSWDGTLWTKLQPTGASPAGRLFPGLAYDTARHRLVLFGGFDGASTPTDTWEWDGAAWTQVVATGAPNVGSGITTIVYDANRQRTVFVEPATPETWEWDGATWTQATYSSYPQMWSGTAMLHDPLRKTNLLVGHEEGGYSTVSHWTWDGAQWTRLSFPSMPLSVFGPTLAWDSTNKVAVLFGGDAYLSSSQAFDVNDTWTWDGTQWTQLAPAVSPSPRHNARGMYDAARKRLVLVGGATLVPTTQGASSFQYFHDVWEWDGTTWSNRTPGGSPPFAWPYDDILTGYDEAHQQALFFSGLVSNIPGSTWSWNGTAWTSLGMSATHPATTDGSRTAFDALRGQLISFGSDGNDDRLWAWDGQTWKDVTPSGPRPPGRQFHSLAYDSDRGQLMAFGGSSSAGTPLTDFWLLDEGTPRRPTAQWNVSLDDLYVDDSAITGLRVQALCGGSSPGGAGASLEGWSAGGSGLSSGAWTKLAANQADLPGGAAMPSLDALQLPWSAASGDEARRYIQLRDQELAFRCTSAGASPAGSNAAAVGLQFMELHVQYHAP